MDHYPDAEGYTMKDKVEVIIRILTGLATVETALRHPILLPDTFGCDFKGKRYWRVWRQTWNRRGGFGDVPAEVVPGQRFVEFFVEIETGGVFKGGWKAPEGDERFNISTAAGRHRLMEHKRLSQFGYLYTETIKQADRLLAS